MCRHIGRAFGDKPSMDLVFTERTIPKIRSPTSNAAFGRFGSALIISVTRMGEILAARWFTARIKKQGFSSIGSIRRTTSVSRMARSKVKLTLTAGRHVWRDLGCEDQVRRSAGEIPKEFQPPSRRSLSRKKTSQHEVLATSQRQMRRTMNPRESQRLRT